MRLTGLFTQLHQDIMIDIIYEFTTKLFCDTLFLCFGTFLDESLLINSNIFFSIYPQPMPSAFCLIFYYNNLHVPLFIETRWKESHP